MVLQFRCYTLTVNGRKWPRVCENTDLGLRFTSTEQKAEDRVVFFLKGTLPFTSIKRGCVVWLDTRKGPGLVSRIFITGFDYSAHRWVVQSRISQSPAWYSRFSDRLPASSQPERVPSHYQTEIAARQHQKNQEKKPRPQLPDSYSTASRQLP